MARSLSSLKAKDLKHLAFLTGCPLASTKSALQTSLTDRLKRPLLPDGAPRIISVDMGIRNLAFSVLTVHNSAQSGPNGRSQTDKDIRVSHWQKLDLLAQLRQIKHAGFGTTEDLAMALDDKEAQSSQAASIFTPPVISQIAYSLTNTILSHRPAVILIERQRFRSGGGSAIQEWTIRVNMLESMLWACLATMKGLGGWTDTAFPAVHSVEPARVAKFWIQMQGRPITFDLEYGAELAQQDTDSESGKKSKITKAQRIAILRRWIHESNDGLSSLTFSDQAEQTLAAFQGSRSKKLGEEPVGKLDDLTDCLMQGLAWARWEANRRSINSLLSSHDKSSL